MDGKTRRGLMMALDLEHYDFSKGSQSLIRATEGTILERLPPRIRIREGAPLEAAAYPGADRRPRPDGDRAAAWTGAAHCSPSMTPT